MIETNNVRNLSKELYDNLAEIIQEFYDNESSSNVGDIFTASLHATTYLLLASVQFVCEVSEDSSKIKDAVIKDFMISIEKIK